MPQNCVVAGCNNVGGKEGISLHVFPKDPGMRKKWVGKVRLTRAQWEGPSERSVICSAHFASEDYVDSFGLHAALGIPAKRRLKPNAVPRIQLAVARAGKRGGERPLSEERKRVKMLNEWLKGGEKDTSRKDIPHAAGSMDKDRNPDPSSSTEETTSGTSDDSEEDMETGEGPEEVPFVSRSSAESTPEPAATRPVSEQSTSRSFATQFACPPPPPPATRVKRVQVSVVTKETGSLIQPEMTSIATQWEPQEEEKKPEEKTHVAAVDYKEDEEIKEKEESMVDENVDKAPKEKEDSPGYSPDESSSSSKEQSTPQKPSKKRKKSRGQRPSTSWEPRSKTKPHLDNKYIVFESNLMELFQRCPTCSSALVDIKIFNKGTLLVVSQECLTCTSPKWTWASQPWYGTTPAGNILLSAAVLFSGGSWAAMEKVTTSMNLVCFGQQTFYRHQRDLLQPAIEAEWQRSQSIIHQELLTAKKTLTIGGDGRADSPGHSAKYGTYTTIELNVNKIVDIQLVQSNEVASSYHMELEGFKRMCEVIKSKGLVIEKLVTDRHRQLAKHVRENAPDVMHLYDVWHLAKAVRKKVHALAKQKDCAVVGDWEKSINNHIYWVAASTTDGEEEMKVAKWESLENHIQGIHEGHSELFPRCLHGDLGDNRQKKWLKPSTMPCEKLGSIITSTTLVKDIRKLSSGKQTASLESFHSLLNQFAPKMKSYGYHGILSRIHLAGLHFNENSNREQATTSTGEKRFKINKLKYKKDGATVKAIKEEAHFTYVSNLLEDVAERTKEYTPRRKPARPAAPPALCSGRTYQSKEELVLRHQSRFNKDQ